MHGAMRALMHFCGPHVVWRSEGSHGRKPHFIKGRDVAGLVATMDHEQASLLRQRAHYRLGLLDRIKVLAGPALRLRRSLDLLGVEHPIAFEREAFALRTLGLAAFARGARRTRRPALILVVARELDDLDDHRPLLALPDLPALGRSLL